LKRSTLLKAAIVTSAGTKPIFGEFDNPVPREGFKVVTVTTAAMTNLTKGRAAGSHYSADNHYPFVPGVDGVGSGLGGKVFTINYHFKDGKTAALDYSRSELLSILHDKVEDYEGIKELPQVIQRHDRRAAGAVRQDILRRRVLGERFDIGHATVSLLLRQDGL
jgi:hypothetical protein